MIYPPKVSQSLMIRCKIHRSLILVPGVLSEAIAHSNVFCVCIYLRYTGTSAIALMMLAFNQWCHCTEDGHSCAQIPPKRSLWGLQRPRSDKESRAFIISLPLLQSSRFCGAARCARRNGIKVVQMTESSPTTSGGHWSFNTKFMPKPKVIT